ncbi:MAG: zf-TFIIB domain-containing protein [Ilumatobacteraceae bacterium]
MNCPLCLDTVLDVTYHAGIELDICPTCRGVWLDRGELNRIVDDVGPRSVSTSMKRRDDRPRIEGQPERPPTNDREYRRSGERGRGHHKKRKKSFASRLGDVFEEIVDL